MGNKIVYAPSNIEFALTIASLTFHIEPGSHKVIAERTNWALMVEFSGFLPFLKYLLQYVANTLKIASSGES